MKLFYRHILPQSLFSITVSMLLTMMLALTCPVFSAVTGEINFTIMHTSDEHSHLLPSPLSDYIVGQPCPASGGFARLATLVKNIRAQKVSEPVLLLSSGDFIGGTPFSWLLLKGIAPEISLMKSLGYTATTFGNHEFDYGPEKLAAYLQHGNPEPGAVALLSANLLIPKGHVFEQLPIKRHLLITLANGLKVGLFGLLGHSAHRLSPAAKPLDFSEQKQAARRETVALREAGADVVIALTHAGLREDTELAEHTSGIDLILGGHDHIKTDLPLLVNDTLIMHSGYFLGSAGHLDLAFNPATRKLRLRNNETQNPFIHKLDGNIAEDPQFAALLDSYQAELNHLLASFTEGDFNDITQVVAHSSFALTKHQLGRETNVGNFVTDAIRFEAAKATGAKVDIAFHANGIIRGNITPGTASQTRNNLTFYDLAALSGLGGGDDGEPGYPLVSFYLSEAEVLNMLEIASLLPLLWGDVYFLQVSGLRYTYDPQRTFWFKIPIINKPLPAYCSILSAEIFAGEGLQNEQNLVPLSPSSNKLYHIATTRYLASHLPMVGSRLPRLNVVLKNKQGQPVELGQTLIKFKNRELKLWEATVRYAMSFASEPGQISQIPEYYREAGGRIIIGRGTHLWSYPAVVILAVFMIFVALRQRRKNKKIQPENT